MTSIFREPVLTDTLRKSKLSGLYKSLDAFTLRGNCAAKAASWNTEQSCFTRVSGYGFARLVQWTPEASRPCNTWWLSPVKEQKPPWPVHFL